MNNLENHGFIRIVPVRTEHGGKDLPASHFKSFYEVAFGDQDNDEAFIRLDVLHESAPYRHTTRLPIDSSFLKQEGCPLLVTVPTKEDILGDKLTAFGPNTLGIPFYKEDRNGNLRRCSLEIIKQLFDIGRLFEAVDSFQDTFLSFQKVSSVESSYRGMEGRLNEYYNDVRGSALCLSTRGKLGEGCFDEFQDGINRIKGYMYQRDYYIENASIDAARTAYLVTCFENGITDIEKYSKSVNLKTMNVFERMPNVLQRLRKTLPEAFYYWAKTYEML